MGVRMRVLALAVLLVGCGGEPDCFDYEALEVPSCAGGRAAIQCDGKDECDTGGGKIVCLDDGTPVRGYNCDCGGKTCVLVVEMSACGWGC
jgi:hypothetical protein